MMVAPENVLAVASGRVPMLDEDGRFPNRFAPPSVAASLTQIEAEVATVVEKASEASESASAAETARDETIIAVPNAYADWSGTIVKTAADVARPGYEKVRLIGNTILMLPAGAPGLAYTRTLKLKQDSSGGRSLVIQNVATPEHLAIPLSTGANSVDKIHCEWDGEVWTVVLMGSDIAVPTAWVV